MSDVSFRKTKVGSTLVRDTDALCRQLAGMDVPDIFPEAIDESERAAAQEKMLTIHAELVQYGNKLGVLSGHRIRNCQLLGQAVSKRT